MINNWLKMPLCHLSPAGYWSTRAVYKAVTDLINSVNSWKCFSGPFCILGSQRAEWNNSLTYSGQPNVADMLLSGTLQPEDLLK